jgi:protein gp37
MAENTAIEWTDHTFNPWWGCTKVGPGCDHCYAETFDKRVGGAHWGPGAPRRLVKDWTGPRKWNAAALRAGTRPWVFCASMADVFDNEVPAEWREALWDLVRSCQQLNWQFVTKRIGNAAKMLPPDWAENFTHCGLIATIVTQAEASRDIPKLLDTPARWRGLSMEPLLERVSLTEIELVGGDYVLNALVPISEAQEWESSWSPEATGMELAACIEDWTEEYGSYPPSETKPRGLDWVIVGGESGPRARPFVLEWAAAIVAECEAAGVPVFVKQIGDAPRAESSVGGTFPFPASKKGKDMAQWLPSLRVRQMPRIYDQAHA